MEVLRKVGGPDCEAPLRALQDIAPDLARFTVEFGYGDVMARPGLDLRTRQMATVAALSAMANARPQLQYHIAGALNVGWEPRQIVEVILLTTVYAGFPAALNGIFAAKEVLERRGLTAAPDRVDGARDRFEHGLRTLRELSRRSGADVVGSLADLAPDLGRFIVEFSYGDVISRPGLDYRTKELATVAILTALGTARSQLKVHIIAALNVGASRQEVIEVIQQMGVYAGFPAALNGIAVAREALAIP